MDGAEEKRRQERAREVRGPSTKAWVVLRAVNVITDCRNIAIFTRLKLQRHAAGTELFN